MTCARLHVVHDISISHITSVYERGFTVHMHYLYAVRIRIDTGAEVAVQMSDSSGMPCCRSVTMRCCIWWQVVFSFCKHANACILEILALHVVLVIY